MKLSQSDIIDAIADYVQKKLGRSARIQVKIFVKGKGDNVEITAEGTEE